MPLLSFLSQSQLGALKRLGAGPEAPIHKADFDDENLCCRGREVLCGRRYSNARCYL